MHRISPESFGNKLHHDNRMILVLLNNQHSASWHISGECLQCHTVLMSLWPTHTLQSLWDTLKSQWNWNCPLWTWEVLERHI